MATAKRHYFTLRRVALRDAYTVGHLLDGKRMICDTMEPRLRDLSREPKVKGHTAIPAGCYRVRLAPSQKFGGLRPRVEAVPWFEGVLMHEGNTPQDTEGCILVGRNTEVGRLTESRRCLSEVMALMAKLEQRGTECFLVIKKMD